MPTKLIQLEEGVLVEVEVLGDRAFPLSSGAADKVSAAISQISPVLLKVCDSLNEVWAKVETNAYLDRAEIAVGLSFEAEGNIYIAKTQAGASLGVTIFLKPTEHGK